MKVICINEYCQVGITKVREHLTLGKIYNVITNADNHYLILNDSLKEIWYRKDDNNLATLKEYRRNKILKINKL